MTLQDVEALTCAAMVVFSFGMIVGMQISRRIEQ